MTPAPIEDGVPRTDEVPQLYVLNAAALILDEHQLHARASAGEASSSARKSHLDYPSPAEAEAAHDLEAVITTALQAAGCRLNWIRVDFIAAGPAADDLDVQFVTERPQTPPR